MTDPLIWVMRILLNTTITNKHVNFDEIPFESDSLYNHQQIYTHEPIHIEYGLYANLEASAAFEMHIHQEPEQSQIEDTNTAYICITWEGPLMKKKSHAKMPYGEKCIMKNKMKYWKLEREYRKEKLKKESEENIQKTHNMDMSQKRHFIDLIKI